MAVRLSEQSGKQNQHKENFSYLVKRLMGKQMLTQRELARQSRLAETTISRIIRNSNDKGGPYQPTDAVVMAVSLAFKLDRAGWERLLFAAFPEREVWFKCLDKRLGVYEADSQLYDQGLPLLGKSKKE